MTTTIIIKSPSGDGIHSPIEYEHQHLLRPPLLVTRTPAFKPFPHSIIKSIENNRTRHLSPARSTSDFRHINQSSLYTTDEDLDENAEIATAYTGRTERSPSDTGITMYSDIPHTSENELRYSAVSLVDRKTTKQNRVDYLRRALLDHRLGRRIHSSFSSSSTIRSLNRRRSTQISSHRFYRRQTNYLSRNSKWHFVRDHLPEIAMMNESYARMKLLERDLRWVHLREQICKRVLDMREISILRQEEAGKLKKSQKTSFDLKTIPSNEVVHVERDGRVYSLGTRDLVLGRLINEEGIQLDTFAQFDARRKFAIKQNLLRQQEGRNRLKKQIAFSFCLCNLSFIALMCVTMFIGLMKTIFLLKSTQYF